MTDPLGQLEAAFARMDAKNPRYGHPARSVRVPDALWQAAKDEAERRGETVTDVIVRSLKRYTKGERRTA